MTALTMTAKHTHPSPLTSRARQRWRSLAALLAALLLASTAAGCTASDSEAANGDDDHDGHDGHAEIRVEPLTPPSTFTDAVAAELSVAFEGYGEEIRELADVSTIVTAEVTIPPGAVFPWHTHPGPVLITIAEGDFVYRLAEDCEDRSYVAGEALVDPGDGVVHTAYNPSDETTVVIATFLGVPEGEALTIPVDGPDPSDCALPSP